MEAVLSKRIVDSERSDISIVGGSTGIIIMLGGRNDSGVGGGGEGGRRMRVLRKG